MLLACAGDMRLHTHINTFQFDLSVFGVALK